MPRFPTPWSKKRGERSLVDSLSSIAGEVAFYAFLFLVGVFGLSLVLINRLAPERIPGVPSEALSTSLSAWVFGTISLAAIVTGAVGVMLRLMRAGASSERRSAIVNRARSGDGGAVDSDFGAAAFDEEVDRLTNVPSGSALNDSPGERQRYRSLVGIFRRCISYHIWQALRLLYVEGSKAKSFSTQRLFYYLNSTS